MFSVLLRVLKSFGSVVEENPYLSVFASDLPELIRRGRVALLHPCWELGMDGDASRQLSDDEFLPKHVQESIYHLTQLLPVLEGESARYSASGNSRRPKSKKSSAREGRPSTTAGQRDELVTTSVAFSGGVCQICLEAKADTRFVPCRHECCRMCFAMYRNSLIAQEDSNMVCFFCKAKITGLNVNDSD
ncbi:hypothetical protein AGDE_15084 [Angomonas deanei]|uniref:Zinc finger, C3HC4 type (RING finger) containing protein, putative n=1 Tax=Angomonas deanei TaxID=59799 RepID=A0A7G2CSC4_9TRYP|nr:hypothetical protein AGDE_15084 [Angomonas deanei]CAD2221102.1 Zinc finger, C3HC4 type (RING finger) containing protein, putative [Angomonas deanei]|eukprot:EPY19712.1 hypothetical protein AGDE_15084 [Angomonas deanei]